MTLTLELPSETENALRETARQQGTTPEHLAVDGLHRLFVLPVPLSAGFVSPTTALFAVWEAEDRTEDAEEIARRQREGDELMDSLRKNRVDFNGRTDFTEVLDVGAESRADV